MQDTDSTILSRRNFLRGAVLLAGATLLQWETAGQATASSAAPATPTASETSLSFWSSRFGNPNNLAGAPILSGQARVAVHDHYVPVGRTGVLNGIAAHYAAQGPDGPIDAPFYAWTGSPGLGPNTAFSIPVAAVGGITFSVDLSSNEQDEFYFLATRSGPGTARLQVGTYALAVGSPNWNSYHLSGNSIVKNAATSADFEYLLLTVSQA